MENAIHRAVLAHLVGMILHSTDPVEESHER
jgi:hypothetical protein